MKHALSDGSAHFSADCPDHTASCEMCDSLEEALVSWSDKAANMDDEEKSYLLEEAIKHIREWRAHILRSVNQDKARTHILENLSDDVSIVTVHIYIII